MVAEGFAVEETIRMSKRERNWLVELRLVAEGKEKLKDAQAKLGGSYRNAKRRLRRLREEGDAGLVHKSRGHPSNRAKPGQVKEQALGLYREHLMGWGPTQAAEKLEEWGVVVDHETLRRWLLKEGLWARARKRKAHRRRRERKEHFGELVQMDGSFHLWLPGSERQICLMVMVDDATGRVWARFFEEETTLAAMELLGRWAELYGIPCALYTDGKSVYVPDDNALQRARDRGEAALTQFGKACARLDIRIIRARSPQAKGRVERMNGTLQNRLVKELALRKITRIENANAFLDGDYLESLNQKFARLPASETDYHRPIPEGEELQASLAIEETRTVGNDWTVRHNNGLYQITGPNHRLPPAKGTVTVRQRLDGSLHMYYRNQEVRFSPIASRPAPPKTAPARTEARTKWVPPPNHPWRGRFVVPGAGNGPAS